MEKNLGIDEDLLNEAVRLGGHRTKAETVNAALREFVDRCRQRQVVNRQRPVVNLQRQVVKMFGTVDYRPDYDNKGRGAEG